MPITVFCDFDGPIIDVSDRYYKTYGLALVETQALYQRQENTLSTNILSKDLFWQMKQNRDPDFVIGMRSGLHQETMYIFLQQVRAIVNQPALLQYDRLQVGAKRAMLLLHSQGVQLVLVTLRRQEQATQILQNYGLARLFFRIYGTQDEQAAYGNQIELKTQLLAQALAEQYKQGEQTDSAWMIGDTEADILAGQSLGIPTIALTCGIRSYSYLQKLYPDEIHSDLLAAAQYLLSHPRQLVA